jgi:hypothetical protein
VIHDWCVKNLERTAGCHDGEASDPDLSDECSSAEFDKPSHQGRRCSSGAALFGSRGWEHLAMHVSSKGDESNRSSCSYGHPDQSCRFQE